VRKVPEDICVSTQKYISTGVVEHELSAVIVHEGPGAAETGSYYLLCRDYSFDTDVVWVRLSNANTREAQLCEITATFGGAAPGLPTTAYGLLYRDCDFAFHTKLGLYPS